jgi:hypothetical protein
VVREDGPYPRDPAGRSWSPVPTSRASKSSAYPGLLAADRSTTASGGSIASTRRRHSCAFATSRGSAPLGVVTSQSSATCRAAPAAIIAACAWIHVCQPPAGAKIDSERSRSDISDISDPTPVRRHEHLDHAVIAKPVTTTQNTDDLWVVTPRRLTIDTQRIPNPEAAGRRRFNEPPASPSAALKSERLLKRRSTNELPFSPANSDQQTGA